MHLFGGRLDDGRSPRTGSAGQRSCGPAGQAPQGLASLLSVLQSKHQAGATPGPPHAAALSYALSGTHGSPQVSLLATGVKPGIFCSIASEAEIAKSASSDVSQKAANVQPVWGLSGVTGHISPVYNSHQPPSPQLREGPSPARRARDQARQLAVSRLTGYPIGSASLTPSLLSYAGDVDAPRLDSPEKVVAELRSALAAAESTARIAAWSNEVTARHKEDMAAGKQLPHTAACHIEDDHAASIAASDSSSELVREDETSSISDQSCRALDDSCRQRLPQRASNHSLATEEATPPKPESAAVAELQAELLAHAAAVAAAERRAELAERKQAESHCLLLSMQDALMQNTISSAAATPISSPRGGSGLSRSPLSSPAGVPMVTGSPLTRGARSALARGVAAEAAAVAREAARSDAARAQADATRIAQLEGELQEARAERDAAVESARQAAIREVPKGLGQLWEQLLAAEETASLAARHDSGSSGSLEGHDRTQSLGSASSIPGSMPRQLVGEIWEQLRASFAEREALKRSASHREAELMHYRRNAAMSPPRGGSGNLSRAFSAAAGRMEPLDLQHTDMSMASMTSSSWKDRSPMGSDGTKTSPFAKASQGHASPPPKRVCHSGRVHLPWSPSSTGLSAAVVQGRAAESDGCSTACCASYGTPASLALQESPVAAWPPMLDVRGASDQSPSYTPAGGILAVVRRLADLSPLASLALAHAASVPRVLSRLLHYDGKPEPLPSPCTPRDTHDLMSSLSLPVSSPKLPPSTSVSSPFFTPAAPESVALFPVPTSAAVSDSCKSRDSGEHRASPTSPIRAGSFTAASKQSAAEGAASEPPEHSVSNVKAAAARIDAAAATEAAERTQRRSPGSPVPRSCGSRASSPLRPRDALLGAVQTADAKAKETQSQPSKDTKLPPSNSVGSAVAAIESRTAAGGSWGTWSMPAGNLLRPETPLQQVASPPNDKHQGA